MAGSPFDPVADEYNAARPAYPDVLYDELEAATGPLADQLVLDGGAGTGIATRQLAQRGARMVALDLGERMLRHAQARSPGLACIVADGNQIPRQARCVDLACVAQSWHWFDPLRAGAEVARVLRPGGYWAAWWNRAAADGDGWFAAYQAIMTATCPGYLRRSHSDGDWAAEPIAATRRFEPGRFFVTRWTRTVRASAWLTDELSKSYVAQLEPAVRDQLLAKIAGIIGAQFGDGQLSVPYLTRMWLARCYSPAVR
jgi:SAM-dependent methyltransferase